MFDLTPDLSEPLSFEEAVRLFQAWGFRVEPGPQWYEVTLIIDSADHRNYSVYPAEQLPAVAAVALSVRRRGQAASARRRTHALRLHRN